MECLDLNAFFFHGWHHAAIKEEKTRLFPKSNDMHVTYKLRPLEEFQGRRSKVGMSFTVKLFFWNHVSKYGIPANVYVSFCKTAPEFAVKKGYYKKHPMMLTL